MIRLATILFLFSLVACGDDAPGGAGVGGTGGHGGSTGAQEFPLAGPYATVFEEDDDFVYFFPENLGAESPWPKAAATVIAAYEAAVEDAWLANHATADHNDPRGDGGVYREPIVAFLRWKLQEDAGGEAWFVGDACALCQAAEWSFDTR